VVGSLDGLPRSGCLLQHASGSVGAAACRYATCSVLVCLCPSDELPESSSLVGVGAAANVVVSLAECPGIMPVSLTGGYDPPNAITCGRTGHSSGEPSEGSGPDRKGEVVGWERGGAQKALEYWQVDTRQ
jgi:hypothetical protein